MATVASRILEAMNIRGMKQTDIVKATKIGKSSMSTYLAGEYVPKQKNTYLIAKALDVNPTWLLGEDVPMEPFNQPIQPEIDYTWSVPLVSAYKNADDSTRRAACNVLQIDYVEPGDGVHPLRVMPVYLFPAAAGTPLYAEDDFEEIEFPEDQVPSNADFGIRIRGDSMEPTIDSGSIVWVKRQQELQNGQIGIFMFHDEAACKRIKKTKDGIQLLSDNEAYPPIEVTDYETFAIVGRVLEYR